MFSGGGNKQSNTLVRSRHNKSRSARGLSMEPLCMFTPQRRPTQNIEMVLRESARCACKHCHGACCSGLITL